MISKKISLGPKNKDPYLVWVEGDISGVLTELVAVTQKVFNVLCQYNCFIPHITIARLKEFIRDIDLRERVTNLCLIESEIFPTGSKYTVLNEIAI